VKGFGWIVGFHAVPGDDETVMRPDTPDDVLLDALLDREGRVALCGHTHLPMDRRLDGWRWVNVGSVGLPFDGDPRACYALLHFDGGRLHVEHCRVQYDVQAVIDRLVAPNKAWVANILRTARPPG
ncbi:MAG: metallophosphoesterase family protein, partial [Chloroflexota bacterium]|jgi:diadenosine tetraphosphatase ApaH/serine/threonine PP2A family protein phosphatase